MLALMFDWRMKIGKSSTCSTKICRKTNFTPSTVMFWNRFLVFYIRSTQEEDVHGAHRRLSAEMIFIELVSQRIRKVTVKKK